MSSLSLEALREKVREHGERMGWPALGVAVGIDGETLRAFATTPGRGVQPATARALADYFDPPIVPMRVAADIKSALVRARESVAFLESLDRSVRADDSASIEAADKPIPTQSEQQDARQSKRKGRGGGQ